MVSDPKPKMSDLSSPLRLLRLTDAYPDEVQRKTIMPDRDRDTVDSRLPDLPGSGSVCSTILEASSSADSLPSMSAYDADWPEGFLNDDSQMFGGQQLVDGLMAEHEPDVVLNGGRRGSPTTPSTGYGASGDNSDSDRDNERVGTSNNSTAVEDDRDDDDDNSNNSHHCMTDDEWEHGCACRWSEDGQTEQDCESQSKTERESDESSEACEDDEGEEDPPPSEHEYNRRHGHRYQGPGAKQRINSKSGWSASESPSPSLDPGRHGYYSSTMAKDTNKTDERNERDDVFTSLNLPALFDIGVLDLPRTRTIKRAAMPQTAAFHWDWWIARLATEARDIDLKAFLARLMRVREKNEIPRVPTSRVALVLESKDRSNVNGISDDEDQQDDGYDDEEEEDANEDDEDSWLEVDVTDVDVDDDETTDSETGSDGDDGDSDDEAEDDAIEQTDNTNGDGDKDSICSNVRPQPRQQPPLAAYNNPLSIADALRNPDRSFASETGWDVFLEHIRQKSRHMRDTRRWRMRGLKNAAGWCKWQRGEWIREDGQFVSEREDEFESKRTMSEKQYLDKTDAAPAAAIDDNRQSGGEIGGDTEQAEDEGANPEADGAQKWTIFVGYRRENA
ncbi:hypothetical protein HRR83_002288 [Exophiala dermatitidis]|uniref:Uncharacterized protein n=2 Tax=Exophiala dermatitidis TaxID=5970 RepID=H6BY08_EXODN|nr:uncharacterized protein HMPREF1120_04705 [Exophiala dermatitidis NIH/UT8656]KAJ4520304.1 hypothetical protein HRR75_002169 [Exophiala dermatitidis]EHY56630.1 hypothetical protein HMPREF1120_04705 [Exophiala dermatitidis NIH/UT8656]KAJ4524168.1 hypothetical protein HRR74_002365 [Exophiala dermatitidis]KAJ4525560.1 hypothetical protein HRR73_002290 [Exophiala dermatitidis]KAJ4536877.1 hypothetical protein HRR76_004903 [Exophiala dermatitidis]